MNASNKLWLLKLSIIFTLALIVIECIVLYLTQDLYFIFILAVLVITYFVLIGVYVKIFKKTLYKRKKK